VTQLPTTRRCAVAQAS